MDNRSECTQLAECCPSSVVATSPKWLFKLMKTERNDKFSSLFTQVAGSRCIRWSRSSVVSLLQKVLLACAGQGSLGQTVGPECLAGES